MKHASWLVLLLLMSTPALPQDEARDRSRGERIQVPSTSWNLHEAAFGRSGDFREFGSYSLGLYGDSSTIVGRRPRDDRHRGLRDESGLFSAGRIEVYPGHPGGIRPR